MRPHSFSSLLACVSARPSNDHQPSVQLLVFLVCIPKVSILRFSLASPPSTVSALPTLIALASPTSTAPASLPPTASASPIAPFRPHPPLLTRHRYCPNCQHLRNAPTSSLLPSVRLQMVDAQLCNGQLFVYSRIPSELTIQNGEHAAHDFSFRWPGMWNSTDDDRQPTMTMHNQ